MELEAEILERAREWERLSRWERRELGRELRRMGLSYGEIIDLVPVKKSTLATFVKPDGTGHRKPPSAWCLHGHEAEKCGCVPYHQGLDRIPPARVRPLELLRAASSIGSSRGLLSPRFRVRVPGGPRSG